ncbi:hypothetical protein RYX36_006613 [Vicia faba]
MHRHTHSSRSFRFIAKKLHIVVTTSSQPSTTTTPETEHSNSNGSAPTEIRSEQPQPPASSLHTIATLCPRDIQHQPQHTVVHHRRTDPNRAV